MSSTRELRRHIRSIRSTRQITKAMEMVASSKMRRSMSATLASRPYAQRALDVIRDLSGSDEVTIQHPLMTPRSIKKVTLLVISSDRGLAGSYDTAVVKTALVFMHEQEKLDREVELITIGRKAELSLGHDGYKSTQSYPHTSAHPEQRDILPLARHLTTTYLEQTTDAVFVIYTDFISALRQEARVRALIPLSAAELTKVPTDNVVNEEEAEAHKAGDHLFIYEPSPEVVLDYVLPRLVEVELYQYLLESLSSEFAARRLAMNNASENASSIIDTLQLTYNGVRQASITQEIAEISGGVAALSTE